MVITWCFWQSLTVYSSDGLWECWAARGQQYCSINKHGCHLQLKALVDSYTEPAMLAWSIQPATGIHASRRAPHNDSTSGSCRWNPLHRGPGKTTGRLPADSWARVVGRFPARSHWHLRGHKEAWGNTEDGSNEYFLCLALCMAGRMGMCSLHIGYLHFYSNYSIMNQFNCGCFLLVLLCTAILHKSVWQVASPPERGGDAGNRCSKMSRSDTSVNNNTTGSIEMSQACAMHAG